MRVFKEAGLEVYYHDEITERNKINGTSWGYWEGKNIIITIDSLLKMRNWSDFSGYNIFMDEFNSLVEYLITCPLLNKNRMDIYNFMTIIIHQSDRVIGTDADINEISLEYMKSISEFNYIRNDYKHNDGIKAEEMFSFNKFIKAIDKEDKWLICCDTVSYTHLTLPTNREV